MKCKYCQKNFEDNDNPVLDYFYHVDVNHYDSLSGDEKIMHDIRKKMIKSKIDYDVHKKTTGDSDLIFNAQNSDIQEFYSSLPGPTTSSGFILLSQSPFTPLISAIIPDMINVITNPKNTV